MEQLAEIYEEGGRKLLKECVHTRNKHIELEERYEKLVSRKASPIDMSALEGVLRKKGEEKASEITVEKESAEIDNEPAEEESAENVEKSEQLIEDAEKESEPLKEEPARENEDDSFEVIIELQKKIISRINAYREEDFFESFFTEKTESAEYLQYKAPRITKLNAEGSFGTAEDFESGNEAAEEAVSEISEEEEIISVEVDEIIMPEKEGLGTVFAVPLENKAGKDEKNESGIRKSAAGIVLAVAVLIAGAIMIYYMWPSLG